MSKPIKMIAWFAGILVLIMVALAIAATLLFDPNDYKQTITKIIRDKTGRELTVQGDIKMTVFPWLGVQLNGLQLSNAAGFGPTPFATVKSANVRAKLIPLLFRKELRTDTIALQGLMLNLGKDKSGKSNWDDLISGDKQGSALNLAALAIGGVEITDSKVVWDDRTSGKAYTLSDMSLRTGALAAGEDFAIDFAADVSSTRSVLNGHVELTSAGNIDPDAKRYQFRGTVIQAQLNSREYPGGKADVELSGDITANLQQQMLTLADIKLQGLGITAQTELHGRNILGDLTFTGPLTINAFNPREALRQLGKTPPPMADPKALTQASLSAQIEGSPQQLNLKKLALKLDTSSLTGSVDVKDFSKLAIGFDLALDQIDVDRYLPPAQKDDAKKQAGAAVAGATGVGISKPLAALRGLDLKGSLRIGSIKVMNVRAAEAVLNLDVPKQTMTLSNPKLELMGMHVDANIRGTKIVDDPSFSGPLKIAPFNPRELMKKLDIDAPQTADPKVLNLASLSAQLDASPQHLKLTRLALKLDDSAINGDLKITNFARPAINFALAIDQINLDRYLPPPVPEANRAPKGKVFTPASAAAAGVLGLPLDSVRKLNTQGSLRIGNLKAKNIRSSAVLINLDARDGLVRLQPLSAQLYQGTYQGNVGLDVRGAIPKFSMDESLSGVQAGPLLKDLYNKDTLSGTATVNAKLNGQGQTSDEIVRTLNGQTAFSFANGVIKGFNIAKLIRDATAKFKGGAAGNEPNQTDFSELRGTATINNGIVHNDDLSAKSPLLRVAGRGDINLVSQQMNYLANVSIVNTLEGQQGRMLEELKGLTIPVKISGPFSNLSYRPDVGAIITDKAKAKVQEKIQEKLEGRLKGKLPGGLLDNLLGKPAPSDAPVGSSSTDAVSPGSADNPPAAEPPADKPARASPEDKLRDALKGLLN
ncbi:MAG: AsmA family protein [Gammaproteobacteria bacterium]